MTSGALFGTGSGVAGSSGGNKHLVEFRAGRMTLKGRMVHPDKRKGLLYVYQGEDSLMHFCWKDRTTGEVEDDLLIFPDDCEFARVEQCTTGRVYVLKFKSFTRKYFFWMQEPKSDKDEEYCRRINEVLNNPPTAGAGGRGGAAGGGGGSGPDGDLQNLLNNMSQQQLMQLFGGVGQIGGLSSLLGTMGTGSRSSPSGSSRGSSVSRSEAAAPRTPARARDTAAAAPAAAAPAAAAPAAAATATPVAAQPRAGQTVVLSDLQRYFSSLGTAPGAGAGAGAGAAGGGGGGGAVDLAGALSSSAVAVAATERAAAGRLASHLPAPSDPEAEDEVRATLLSPHFAQAASLFSSALSSGQLAPVVSQFGLGGEAVAAASSGDIQAFFKALEGQGASGAGAEDAKEADPEVEKDDKPKEDKSKKGDDDSMNVE